MNPNPSLPKTSRSRSEIWVGNLLIIPGLGTWWCGLRWLAITQMITALFGFWLFLVGILKMFFIRSGFDHLFLKRSLLETDPFPYLSTGLLIFVAAWISGLWVCVKNSAEGTHK